MPRRAVDPTTGLTYMQEVMAQALAAGKTQMDAYREAYPAAEGQSEGTIASKSSRLAHNPKIKARVEALRDAASRIAAVMVADKIQEIEAEKEKVDRAVAAKIAYDLDVAMAECETAMQLAVKMGQAGALVSAIRLRAELQRLLVHQSETRNVDEFGMPRRRDEAEQLLERLRKEAKARAKTPAILPKTSGG